RQGPADRQHALEEVHEIIRLRDEFPEGDLRLIHIVIGARPPDEEPYPSAATGRGRIPRERQEIGRLSTSSLAQQPSSLFVRDACRDWMPPGHLREGEHLPPLGFTLEHPSPPEPLEHLIGLEHERPLHLWRFPHH